MNWRWVLLRSSGMALTPISLGHRFCLMLLKLGILYQFVSYYQLSRKEFLLING
jgi:hypothetical protein